MSSTKAENTSLLRYFNQGQDHPSMPEPTSESSGQSRKMASPHLGEAEEDVLSQGLIAGLMLKMFLERPLASQEPEFQRHKLKSWMTSTLAAQLAGHLPLASFNRLARGLDLWFEILYPLFTESGIGKLKEEALAPSLSPKRGRLRENWLRHCLSEARGLLPHRRHRKLDQEKLLAFLKGTGGGWFRLRDFEAFFQVDRKTAWEYVHKLVQAGFLVHNQGQSSAVRYRLASAFVATPEDPDKEGPPPWVRPSPH